MAKVDYRTIVLFLAPIFTLFIDGAVGGRHLNKHVVKTIKMKGGDIFDCVDIYKQPAFDHPSLKNHTIQMMPSDYTAKTEKLATSKPIPDLWHESESCPDGTIPIRRTQTSSSIDGNFLKGFESKDATVGPEHVLVVMQSNEFYGAEATLNIWNIKVELNESSQSSIFVVGSTGKDFISVGWIVNNLIYGDQKTRFFTAWGSAKSQGCYDLRCPGFVHVNKRVPLGGYFTEFSTYEGLQKQITLRVYLDKYFNNWWLVYSGTPVGYWPASLFQNMAVATVLNFGGVVYNSAKNGEHTTTQMGSGHSAEQGNKRAAYVANVLYIDKNNEGQKPGKVSVVSDSPFCYDFQSDIYHDRPGYSFFYGGPGFDGNRCK